jgi:hypothetical protein
MAIDFKRFNLGKTKVTIERFVGSYTDGVFSETLSETIEVFASSQPYITIAGDLIPDPTRGEDVEKPLVLYLADRIFMNDSTDPDHTVSDILTIDNRKWKPVQVQRWDFLRLPHYRCVLRLFDGY